MNEDDQALLAMADARMSTASIAGILGWSAARVERRLAVLRPPPPCEVIAFPPAAPAPPPSWSLGLTAHLFDLDPEDLAAEA